MNIINVAIINKETNICENIAVFTDIETAKEMYKDKYIVTTVAEGFWTGDIYHDGKWEHAAKDEEVVADDETLHTQ